MCFFYITISKLNNKSRYCFNIPKQLLRSHWLPLSRLNYRNYIAHFICHWKESTRSHAVSSFFFFLVVTVFATCSSVLYRDRLITAIIPHVPRKFRRFIPKTDASRVSGFARSTISARSTCNVLMSLFSGT